MHPLALPPVRYLWAPKWQELIPSLPHWHTCLRGREYKEDVSRRVISPPDTTTMLSGRALWGYALGLAVNCISTANKFGVGGDHALALLRGVNAVIRLQAHSDEGGWACKPLANASYQIPGDLIFKGSDPIAGINCNYNVQGSYVPCICLGMVGYLASCISTSDPGDVENEMPMIFTRDKNRLGWASDCKGLKESFYEVLRAVISTVTEDWNLNNDKPSGDGRSAKGYFQLDPVRCHFSSNLIVPFYWVDPCAWMTSSHSACAVGTERKLAYVAL